MYHIHTTPGFIVNARPYGEAGKMLSIFTREFGLITARAQGIRLERSKLRYYAQEYFLGTFSLVKGKEFWRLTSAAPFSLRTFSPGLRWPDPPAAFASLKSEKSSPRSGSGSDSKKELIARLALLLKRLLQGEEARPEAFDVIQTCIEFIETQPDVYAERLAALESLTVARILHWLGYIGDDKELNGHMQSLEITTGSLDRLQKKRTIFNMHINKALKESQL